MLHGDCTVDFVEKKFIWMHHQMCNLIYILQVAKRYFVQQRGKIIDLCSFSTKIEEINPVWYCCRGKCTGTEKNSLLQRFPLHSTTRKRERETKKFLVSLLPRCLTARLSPNLRYNKMLLLYFLLYFCRPLGLIKNSKSKQFSAPRKLRSLTCVKPKYNFENWKIRPNTAIRHFLVVFHIFDQPYYSTTDADAITYPFYGLQSPTDTCKGIQESPTIYFPSQAIQLENDSIYDTLCCLLGCLVTISLIALPLNNATFLLKALFVNQLLGTTAVLKCMQHHQYNKYWQC